MLQRFSPLMATDKPMWFLGYDVLLAFALSAKVHPDPQYNALYGCDEVNELLTFCKGRSKITAGVGLKTRHP